MTAPFDIAALKKYPPAQLAQMLSDAKRILAERHLFEFYKQAWNWIDPAPFQYGWHLQAIAEHLEAVSRGEIKRLLINMPPRHSKSALCTIVWPAWCWIKKRGEFPLQGPQVKFLCLSYSKTLSLDHATLMHRLVNSPWYQSNWGKIVKLAGDQDAKEKFDTTAGGSRISSGFGGSVTGRGGDIKIFDDPIKVDDANSEVIRDGVNREYDETLSNRVTDPSIAAEVIVMQRVHENDLSGHILERKRDTVHLCLPAEHDITRHCVTRWIDHEGDEVEWEDPRVDDGEPLWPELWNAKTLQPLKANEYVWAGQYQQSPVPRGGGIIKYEWWQPWQSEKHPKYIYVLASLDTAYTSKEENDFSALVVLGVFLDSMQRPRVLLSHAWQERLELNALVTKAADTCQKLKVDRLLIENKAAGHSVAQEIKRLYRRSSFVTELVDPTPQRGKVARVHAVVPMFTDGAVFAPMVSEGGSLIPSRQWVQDVLDQVTAFPKGAHDDLCDGLSQGLHYLRTNGILKLVSETKAEEAERSQVKKRYKPLYAV